MSLAPLAIAAAVAFATAALFYPALALNRTRRLGFLVVSLTAIVLTPLLIPPERTFLRLLSSMLATAFGAKLYDLHLGAGQGHRLDLRTFLLFLPNFASLVARRLDAEPRPSRSADFAQLARNVLGCACGIAVFVVVFQRDWRQTPFAVEHAVKVVALFLVLIPSTQAAVAAWRLVGGKARSPMDNPFASRTPADFWKRYNRPAQQFFYEDVFKPLGGLRAPARAIIATFAVSAVIHEYVFGIAIGRVQGYQTAFFLLQGLAVAATAGLKPKGWSVAFWVLATLAFNLASSVLFFASLDQAVPFYARRGSESLRFW
jgi:hypothetical protein